LDGIKGRDKDGRYQSRLEDANIRRDSLAGVVEAYWKDWEHLKSAVFRNSVFSVYLEWFDVSEPGSEFEEWLG
jgi:hypothetical protein